MFINTHQILVKITLEILKFNSKKGKLKGFVFFSETLIDLYLDFTSVFNFCFFEQSEFIRL